MLSSRFAVQVLGGLSLGFLLSRGGLSDWSKLHQMFQLRSAELYVLFGAAVLFSMPLWQLLRSRGVRLRPRPIHQGSVVGAVIFGIGWSISGACPAVAFIQLGEGKLLALFTAVGIFCGDALFKLAQAKFLPFEPPSCSDE